MQEILQLLLTAWPAALGTVVTGFLIPWLKRTGKEATARRFALIARAVAAEFINQFPQLEVGQLIDKVLRILIDRWQIDPATAKRIATDAVKQAQAAEALATRRVVGVVAGS